MNHRYQPILIFSILLWGILPGSCLAQRNLLKLRGGTGNLPYEVQFGWNAEVQYEYSLPFAMKIFTSAGLNTANFNYHGDSNGRPWSYTTKERFFYTDLGFKFGVIPLKKRLELNTGVGASFGLSRYQYPKSLYIRKGAVVSREDAFQKVGVFMGLLVLDANVFFNDHVFMGGQATYRSLFKERFELSRVLVVDNGTVKTDSGINWIVTFSLHLGYRF